MKKIYTLLAACLMVCNLAYGQVTQFITAPPYDNSTSANRSPNGTSAHAYMRACQLVLASELTGISPTNNTLTAFGFTLNNGATTNSPTGNFTLYIQNTSDVTYSKGTNFATAIAGMTVAYASTMSIPISPGATSMMVTLSTPITYTGGGLYVAYDWYCPAPYSTIASTYQCNSTGLAGGCFSGASASSAPATLSSSSFRPCLLLGVPNPYTNDVQVVNVDANGRVAGMFNQPQVVNATIRNSSSVTQTNMVVNLSVSGANSFADTKTITTLAAGASSLVSFNSYTPSIAGLNTISVSVASDQNNANNAATYAQSVTCNQWALNPASGSYTAGVGFGTGSGLLVQSYTPPMTASLLELRGSLSTDANAVGKNSWGVLLSSTGVVIATTNTITFTAGMLGTFLTYSFATPQTLSSGTSYYFGFAQPASATANYPAGILNSGFFPTSYFTVALNGGTPAPLANTFGHFGIEAIFAPIGPAITLSSPTVTCGNQATITATTSASYTWTSGPANTSLVVTPTVSSIYTVTTLATTGCTGTSTASVQVTPISISAAGGSVCPGDAFDIVPSGAFLYVFSDGTSTTMATSQMVTPLSTSIYSVVGGNSNGCLSPVLQVTVTVYPAPTVAVNSSNICSGASAVITPSGNATSYTVSGGNYTVSPMVTTEYSVSGSDANGCVSAFAISTVVVNSTPTVATNEGAICKGATFNIVPTGNADTYSVVGIPLSSTPSVSTTFTVMGINLNGCSLSVVNTVTVNALPAVSIQATRTLICKGESSSLTAMGASTYSWTGIAQSGSLAVVSPTLVGLTNYTLTGTDVNGCVNTFSIAMQVSACAGLEAHQAGSLIFNVYPNPNNGQFTVEAPVNTRLQVINAVGQLVHSLNTEGTLAHINIEHLDAGIYFIKAIQGTSQQTLKIIKD